MTRKAHGIPEIATLGDLQQPRGRDRAGLGVVTDYMHSGRFPALNLANTAIVTGAALRVLTTRRQPATARFGEDRACATPDDVNQVGGFR